MARDSSALSRALSTALKSRESRGILRRLPDPIPSTTTQSAQIDFTSNDYLSLTRSASLRETVLQRLHGEARILGTGGSRLLLNPPEFASFEQNLTDFLGTTEHDGHHTEALLFNSGFDANVSFFSCIPQPGDHVVYDEYIHASVHDGLRASRLPKSSTKPFIHNDLDSLHQRLSELGNVQGSVFVSVESLYSMDGTFAPLQDIVTLLETLFPRGNGYLIVDEAHSTGIYGAEGRGRVAECNLSGHPLVLARLHTFGKALGGSGAVLILPPLLRKYLINYARPLIYTTSLSHLNLVAVACSFDFLQSPARDYLVQHLHDLIRYLLVSFRAMSIPSGLVTLPIHLNGASLPSPIIPLLTPQAHSLAAFLREEFKCNVRPITWPTVPKGMDRVRICLHAGNTMQEIDVLLRGIKQWASHMDEDGKPVLARL